MSAVPVDVAPERAAAAIVAAHEGDPAWLEAFAEELDRRRIGHEVERILRVWGLSRAEAGRLLGVTRQAVAKWLDRGVPADRAEQVADLAAATDLLERHLKHERIPAVVRRRAPRLGGRSLVELLASAGSRRVLDATRDMFAFGDAQA